jgi:ParB-like chromosome segregation protein Spo0J
MRYLRTLDVPIDALQPFPGNARRHDEAALDESAETNGQFRSVVARDMGDGVPPQVLAGHGTWGAFTRRGDATIRVELIEADDTEARRIVLADNGSSRNASYDDQALLALLEAAAEDGGLAGTGWDDQARDDLLTLAGDLPDLDDLDDAEPNDRELWPAIRIVVPPETRKDFLALMDHPEFEAWNEEHERFAAILTAARNQMGDAGE